MKLLITGGGGFVGRKLFSFLVTQTEHEVFAPSSAQLDLLNYSSIVESLEHFAPDLVVHLASIHGNTLTKQINKFEILALNSIMDMNLLRAMDCYGIKKIINLSSVLVYPSVNNHGIPYHENVLDTFDESKLTSTYAKSKMRFLYALSLLADSKKINSLSLIAPSIYGPGDSYDLNSAHFFAAAIAKICGQPSRKPFVPILGCPLHEYREAIYINDLVSILAQSISIISTETTIPSIVNLPGSTYLSIHQYFQMISSVAGKEPFFEYKECSSTKYYSRLSSDIFNKYFSVIYTDFTSACTETINHFYRDINL